MIFRFGRPHQGVDPYQHLMTIWADVCDGGEPVLEEKKSETSAEETQEKEEAEVKKNIVG